jgi:preprotein translocase subunit SecB
MRADVGQPGSAPGGGRLPAPIVINAQYMKDASLEVPNAPRVFALMQKSSPDISVNIDVKAQPIQDNAFEVQFHVHAKCAIGETVAFIVEVVYAGLFSVHVSRELLEPTLLIECPRLLFPFARNIVADLTRDGGFPPLMLGPVDFTAMYQNQLQRRATGGTQPSPGGEAVSTAQQT